jgi:hypothetical protein
MECILRWSEIFLFSTYFIHVSDIVPVFLFVSRGELGSKILHGNWFYKGHRDIAEKTLHHFKKASIPLKMYLKSLAILEKASISLKKSSKIIEIFIKAPHF